VLRFTIRELVLLTLVVAMGLGWSASYLASDRPRMQWRQHALESVLAEEGWLIEQDGWDVSFRKAGDPKPRYAFGVTWPEPE